MIYTKDVNKSYANKIGIWLGGNDMTIAELKEILNEFDDDKDVIIWCPENETLYETDEVYGDNNGHLQLTTI